MLFRRTAKHRKLSDKEIKRLLAIRAKEDSRYDSELEKREEDLNDAKLYPITEPQVRTYPSRWLPDGTFLG